MLALLFAGTLRYTFSPKVDSILRLLAHRQTRISLINVYLLKVAVFIVFCLCELLTYYTPNIVHTSNHKSIVRHLQCLALCLYNLTVYRSLSHVELCNSNAHCL